MDATNGSLPNTNILHLPEADFGPAAQGRFDFTLTFESAILSIAPSIAFFMLAPQRLVWLLKQPRKVSKSARPALKLALIGTYTVLQLAVLLFCTIGPLPSLASQLAAAMLVVVNGFLLLFVSHAEHTRSVKPSTLINVYLLLTLLFDCAIARTAWLTNGTSSIPRLYTAAATIKLLILAAEAWEKRAILLSRYQYLSPEATSGILGRSVFWWLNPLMKAGFGRFLTDQDLYPIPDAMTGEKLLPKAQSSWASVNQLKKNSLFWSTMWTTKYAFLSGMLARVCLIGFKYAQPFLIHRTTGFTEDLTQPDEVGWALTGAWLLVFIGLGISNGFYYHLTYRFVTSVRGSLCSMIYDKTLDLSVTALDESIAVTLMSTDTDAICNSFVTLHEVWASPVECGVGLYLLYQQLGLAFIAPMVVSIGATAATIQLANHIGNAQKQWVRGVQTRVDVTASMLGSMKEVKMLAFSDLLSDMVQKLRVKELERSKDYRRLISIRVLLGSSMQTIAPLATFATFVIISNSTGQALDVSSAYTSLSLIYLLADPITTVIRTIPRISTALACFDRIRGFLLSESCNDHRLSLELSNDIPVSVSVNGETPSRGSPTPLQDLTAPIELRHIPRSTTSHLEAPLITITDASFGWKSTEPPILSNISCTVRPSEFAFVIGNVGSGKSTLMKAMLGEIKPSKGVVYTSARQIAFVSQDPWIQNLTICENILGVSSYDEAWYNRVVHACGLEQDIAELPKLDATKAGSAGVSLSGGQKQRLALARAVYSKANVVFLDDVFAGQDAATEEHIHRCLFAEGGLFREMGTTVVCITNAIYRLEYADHVIALGENGDIFHQGTLDQLRSGTDYLQGLSAKQNGSAKEEITTDPTGAKAKPIASPPTRPKDVSPDTSKTFLGDLATYAYYFGSVPRWYLVALVIFVTLYGGGIRLTELLLSYWTAGQASNSSSATNSNSFYLGLYGMLAGIATAGIVGSSYFYLVVMVPRSSEVLHARLLQSVINAPLSFFSRTDVGVVTNRFSQDMSVIDSELPYAFIDFALDFAVTLFSAILMCVFSGYFAAVLPPVVFLCWLLQRFYLKTSRQIRILDLEAKSPLFTQFLDLLQGLASVRAFAWQAAFKERFLELLDASQRPYYLLFCVQRWLALVLDMIVAVLATILMVLVVKLRAGFSPQFVALALLNVTSFSQFLAYVIQSWTLLETSLGAVARVREFCEATENENRPAETELAPERWPASGHVALENVTASYASDLKEPVLHSVTLNIPAGAKVGICGRSGSGKSSLVACLLRMLELAPGSRITFDGVDIAMLPRQAVRAAVAVVPQHPFFLRNTSIRDNLVPRDATGQLPQRDIDAKVLSVLSRLKMADAVERMGGLDSVLDLDRLSQGQRQLLCLARAVLANKRIVLLDEASSNVDERSERLIRQVVKEEFASCTVIAIVHRLGAIADFDRVAVVAGGRVVEWDNPRALLKREDSEFKRLWDLSSS